ncbi:MAG: co-chaperone YbbN [Nocardioidaceae bacterium]
MTTPSFSRPGAIDLSGLRSPVAAAAGGTSTATGAYSFDVTSEAALRADVVERSMSVVVLVSFWADEVPASLQVNQVLEKLADEFAGRFLLAKVDAGTQPELTAALGIPQVPLVVAALRGQLAPLIQDPLPEPEMRQLVEQILQAAAANGISGVAEPLTTSAPIDDAPAADAEPPVKYPEAEAALMSGDLDAAIAAYEAALKESPGDAEAAIGLSRSRLLQRTQGVDQATARATAASGPDDIEAQTLVADIDLLGGHVEDAFDRLLDFVRRIRGDDRDAARQHLIEMFAVVGDTDPRVSRARQMLASALF